MNKKTAIIFTGLPRIYEKSMLFWEKVISKYNPDIFVHTWEQPNGYEHLNNFSKRFKITSIKVDTLSNFDNEKYAHRSWPNINVYNIFSSWESVKRGYQLMESVYQALPDIIIRARLDLYSPYFDLLDLPTLIIPMSPNKWPGCFHFKEQFLVSQQDVLCYGPPEYVRRYCHLIDNIPYLMESDSSLPMVSEYVMAAHLWSQQVPYFSHLFPYELVRE